MGRSEDDWIRAIAGRFPAGPRTQVGIGHDAAVVELDGRQVVLKTDVVIDGVDFRLAECGPGAAARKALAVNVSDLAAMAALPRACVVGAVLPRGVEFDLFDALAKGFADAAAELSCDVVGGDTSVADGPLVLAVAAVGEPGPYGVYTRAGGVPGDAVSVTGALGGSILGRHLTFVPRVREGQVLAARGIPHAMMDLSDGLSTDLRRLCAASGCGADVVAEWVPIHPDAHRAPTPGTPLERALNDGEDFELLVAHAPLSPGAVSELAREGVTLHRVGTLTKAPAGVRLVERGAARDLPPQGYDHLRKP
jgi:thiamine-monophosphate kinase